MNDPTNLRGSVRPEAADADHDLAFHAFCGPRRRSSAKRGAGALLSLALFAALACGAIYWAMGRGPIEVAFLSDRIATGLEQQFGGGIDVEVGRTVIERQGRSIGLHVLDVVLKGTRGQEILRAPDALVSFNPWQLLRLRVLPDKLSLRGMAMRAEIGPDGDVLFTTAAAEASSGTASTAKFADVVSFILGLGSPDGAEGVATISIVDASLVIDDRRNGKQLSFQNMNLAFGTPQPGVLEATGSLRKEGDTVPFSMISEEEPGGRKLRFAFSGVGDHVLQAVLGAKTPYFRLGAKLRASAEIVIGDDARARSATFEFGMGRGDVDIPALAPSRYAIERFAATARWDAQRPRDASLSFAFEGAGLKIAMAGPLAVPENGAEPWRWDARGGGWTLAPLTPADRPITVDNAELRLTVDPAARALEVHRLAVEGPGTQIALAARLGFEEQGPGLALTLEGGRMPLRTALRWWPSFVSSHARMFFVDAARDGDLAKLALTLAMPPPVFQKAMRLEALPRESIVLEAVVDGGALALSAGLPPIAGLQGQGRLDAVGAQGTFTRGWVEQRPGRRVALTDGSFQIDGLDTWRPRSLFKFRAAGALEAVAEVLQAPDLKSAHGFDVDPAHLKGQFEGQVSVALPLGADVKARDIVTEVTGRMNGVAIEKAIGKDRLEGGTLTVSTDRSGVAVKGEARWQGTPVTIALETDLADNKTSAVMSLQLDEAALRKRGFNLQGQLQGPLGVRIRSLSDARGSQRAQIEIDLARAAIDGLLPGLQKPAGRPGKLTFEAMEKANGYAIQNIALDAGVSSFRGQAEATADGVVTSARFSLFRLSPGDNVKLDYDRTATGAKVTIRGNNLDARPFLRVASQPDAARKEAERDLDVDLKTTLLSGHGGEVLTGAEARVALRGGQARQLYLSGKLNGRNLSMSGRAAGDAPLPIALESADAGAFLRYLDLYSRMIGGDMSGQIMVSPRSTSGYVIAREFGLRNEPAIRRLVAEAPPNAANLAANDVRFTRMRIDFSRDGTETAIKDAVIFGPQLGLTFNGVIDQTRDRVSLSGTYVPAYGLNNAFAQIPIVGNILAGGRNEGLLAVTFGVSGRSSDPTVTANPLSAVAPGIFRKIFEFRNDRTGSIPPQTYNPASD